MYPDKVYYCQCLKVVIMMCLVNGDYCLKDICSKIKKSKVNRLFFCTKCGDQKRSVIFSCKDHMRLRTFWLEMDIYQTITETIVKSV